MNHNRKPHTRTLVFLGKIFDDSEVSKGSVRPVDLYLKNFTGNLIKPKILQPKSRTIYYIYIDQNSSKATTVSMKDMVK